MDVCRRGGKEIFLSFEDEFENLVRPDQAPHSGPTGGQFKGRSPGQMRNWFRELHVFGPEMALSQRLDSAASPAPGFRAGPFKRSRTNCRRGIRKKYMAILSGVGARETTTHAEGYQLQGELYGQKIGS